MPDEWATAEDNALTDRAIEELRRRENLVDGRARRDRLNAAPLVAQRGKG